MSEHNHECGCGCNHDHDHEETLIVTLALDDGKDLDCEVVAIFPCDEKDYIALTPVEESEEEQQLFFFRFIPGENDEAEIVNIETEEEFETVAEAYDEFLDSAEWNEMMGEEE